MAKEVIMPALGMAQETGTLLSWHKTEGESVKKGELLMTVATDKTDVDIEAPVDGILRGVLLQEGEEAPVGEVIAWLLADGEALPDVAQPQLDESASPKAPTSPVQEKSTLLTPVAATPLAARVAAEHNIDITQVPASGDRIQKEDVLAYLATQQPATQPSAPTTTNGQGRVLASPKARRLAQEQGLDLATINGSGPEGAVLAADIADAAAAATITPPAVSTVLSSAPAPELSPSTAATPIAMSRPWRIMAQRLQESWQTVPHFYLERDVQAQPLIDWRTQLNGRQTTKVTYTDLLVKLVAAALRIHPRVNAAWHNDAIIVNEAINIGLAVAVEEGLLVPVIHAADQLGVTAIAEQRALLVERAADGKLQPNDMVNGTFTISNLGMFGVDRFNAIVNPPQAAILAVGSMSERVVPVKGKAKVRPMMTLTLSCDHRIVDGARAAQFLQTLATYIEAPLSLLD
ncbi:MAG: 2-oxo acid dehydrogenase subunit E2 [Caldilineaceae bacterium]|nr:2-oxo acid dehydrogenase subunit E2 [Caldilineaceae bacterium]